MNIYERLKRDHEDHRDMLRKIVETSGDSPERKELWNQLRAEAEAHANAEEQVFYATLIEQPDGQEKARHSVSEHKEASDLIDEIGEMELSNPQWLPKVKKLKEELEHHMKEEEREVFQLAKRLIPEQEAREMVARFDERKSDELEQLEAAAS